MCVCVRGGGGGGGGDTSQFSLFGDGCNVAITTQYILHVTQLTLASGMLVTLNFFIHCQSLLFPFYICMCFIVQY